MEVQTTAFIDPQTGQQIQHMNPMEKSRRMTDKLFLIVFPLIVILWLASRFAAFILGSFANERDSRTDEEYAETLRKIMHFIDPFVVRFSVQTIAGLVLSIVYTTFCLFLYEKWTKVFAYLGIVMSLYFCIDGLIMTPYLFSYSVSSTRKIFFTFVLLAMIVYAISFSKVDKNVPCDINKDFCRTIVRSPSIIIFTGLITILVLRVVSFASDALSSIFLSDRHVYHRGFDFAVVIFGGMCVLSFIFNFAVMIISDYTVDYYWKNASIILTLVRVLRNHMGTIMLSSLPLIPFVCTLVQALKHKRSRKNDENINFYYASRLSLVLDIPCTALAFSAIYGTGFVKSTQKMFDTLLRHCLLYLATIGVTDALIILTFWFLEHFFGQAIELWKQFWKDDLGQNKIHMDVSFYKATWYHFLTFAVILHYSARALLANKIIILDKEDECTGGKAEILNQL